MRLKQRAHLGVAVLIVLQATKPTQATPGNGLKYDGWAPLCDISKNLAHFYTEHATSAQRALTRDEQLIIEEYQLRIYLELQQGETAIKTAPVLQHFTSIEVATADQLKTSLGKALSAERSIAHLHGRIAEYLGIMADAHSSSGTHGCLLASGDNAATTGKAQLAACHLEAKPKAKTAPAEYSTNPRQLFGNAQTHAANTDLTDNDQKCELTRISSAGGMISSNNGAVKVDLAGGYYFIAASGTALQRTGLTDYNPTARGSQPETYYQAQKDLDGYNSDTTVQRPDYARPSDQDVHSSQEAKKAIKKFILGDNTKYEGTTDDNKVKATLDDTYAPGKEYSVAKVWQKMAATNIEKSIYRHGEQGTEKLTNINDLNDLRRILTHYQGAKARELAEVHEELRKSKLSGQTETSDLSKNKKACAQHKSDKKACEADSNCIWRGGENEAEGECEVNTTKLTKEAKKAGGGATGIEDPNCSDYTDPEKCSKAPGKPKEGKKAVCGWIEGKCQDSSILVSKQFALSVVSAAFMALLF
uniref:Variant surface glycoprotein 1125.130 n=1 Tax=Trypanosoma brucei TaxID=5691 RepID=A0A1J0R5A7_9TRYP|nr:variant surface glycoprotein 1125.130 [Trypanosoma brucei]